jgi:hypothetical protein
MNKSRKNRTREEILKEVEEQEKMIKKAMDGETVLCTKCGAPLEYKGHGSGVHPGVFCANGCTEILIEYGKE